MPGEPVSQSAPPPSPSDLDLYCLECGYNLRGLSGDPRRCPECGHTNALRDLGVALALITAQLRRMETALTACIGAALLSGTLLGLFAFLSGRGRAEAEDRVRFLVPASIAVLAWFASVLKFRSSCLGHGGWSKLLWRYHLAAIVLVSLLIVAIAPVLYGLFTSSPQGSKVIPLPAYIVSVVAALLLIYGAKGVRSRTKVKMRALQQGVSLKLAQQYHRSRSRR